MEEKLLELFKLAELLNSKQNQVYAEITYSADDRKILEICIRSKKDFSYFSKNSVQLNENSLFKIQDITKSFEKYVGGAVNE